MEISTRRATMEDAAALSALSSKTFYDTFTGTCTEEDMQSFLQHYYNIDQVKKELSDEQDIYWLVFVDDKLAGYMRYKEDYESLPEIKKWKALELKRIYIDKPYHGLGIAQKLMELYFKAVSDGKYEVAWLGVWEHNTRAQRFYEKYGFKDSGYTHDFPIGNTPQTDKWLWKFV